VKIPVVFVQSTPSIEYSNEPLPPVAVIVIVPSVTLQFVGLVEVTLVILGAFGAVKIT